MLVFKCRLVSFDIAAAATGSEFAARGFASIYLMFG